MEVAVKCFLLVVLFSDFPLSVLSQAEDQTGFISIDCGILEGYNSSYGFNYVSDSGFIDTGVNHNISSAINATYIPDEYQTLRSFPDGAKSCYTLKPRQGKNNKYLIRAGFMYGNYDNKSDVPRFDLYLGGNWWNTVTLNDAYTYWYYDIIYIADSDTIDVCLVNTGFGTPFISVLELRLLDNNTYVNVIAYRALDLFFRVDYGSGSVVRFPDDVYDRIWSPWYDKRCKMLSTNLTIEPTSTINNIENSSLPPLLKSFEVYLVKEFLQSETHSQDVDAIMDIKATYNLTKYWQGDPCEPKNAIWEGLNCSYKDYDLPRIISLNLSSSGLRGPISPSIAKLTMLRYLDLSNNSLSGPIPDFLTRLKFLTILNLAQNELSRPIPKELTDKSHNGSLSLSTI